jgi:hypothetical protein
MHSFVVKTKECAMDHDTEIDALSHAAEQVKRQRALVVTLAKAKRFEELPAAHQVLRQMEDALKLERAHRTAAN